MIDSWLLIGFVIVACITRDVQSKVATFIALAVGAHFVVDGLVPDTYFARFGLAATVDAFILIYLLRHVSVLNSATVDIAAMFFISMLVNIFMGLTDSLGLNAYEIYYPFAILQHTMILILVFFGADNGRDNPLRELVNLFNSALIGRVQKASK